MRALRFHGNKDIRIDDIPIPGLKPGYVRVKNAYAGICGSDLHEYSIGPLNAPTEAHVLTGETLPTVCGHEFGGTVDALGEGVDDIKVGQKVAVFPILSDGECTWCQSETYGLCPKWGFIGYSGSGGGMAEYITVERRALHLIPGSMPLEVAALVEPLAVAWHGVKIAKVDTEQDCLVVGAGPIGIAVVHCLTAHNVKRILVSEPSPSRRANALVAGAHHVFDPTQDDAALRCREVTEGMGAHVVFECSGVQAGFDVALDAIRGRGTLVNIAIYEKPLTIKTPNKLNRWSLTYIGSNTYTRQEFQDVIDAIASGAIKNPESMITAKIPLSKAVTAGFEELMANKDKHIKILIDPSQ